MTEQSKRPRDELIELIGEGKLDRTLQLMGQMLVQEILPTLDEINKKLARQYWRSACIEMVMSEISIIYSHLQDHWGPKRTDLELQHEGWVDRMRKALERLEREGAK